MENFQINVENEYKYKKIGRRFPLPDCVPVFPYKPEPIFEKIPETKTWMKWIYETSLMSPKEFRFVQGVGEFIAHFYPFCTDITRYENVYKYMSSLYVCDDQFEIEIEAALLKTDRTDQTVSTIPEQYEQVIDKLVDNSIPMNGWKPYFMAMFGSLQQIYLSYNEVQKRRFITVWKHYIQGLKDERNYLGENKQVNSYDDMIELKNKSGAVRTGVQILEYSNNLFVSEEQWESPDFQTLLDLISKHMSLLNDIFSFEKEFIQNNEDLTKLTNLVAFYSIRDNCSIEVALDKSTATIKDIEKQIQSIEHKIMDRIDCEKSTKEFINLVNYSMGGNYFAHTFMDRYRNF